MRATLIIAHVGGRGGCVLKVRDDAPMRIAVTGKGGAGKSVFSGTLARFLARSGERVLALDSDPMPGLSLSLGMGALPDPLLQDAAARDENGRWRLVRGIGPATAVRRYARRGPDGVYLLQFGKATEKGLSEIMPSVNAFYQLVHKLARSSSLAEWSVVGDLPAGPRQAAFNWAPYARAVVVVVEPTWKSVLTARRIARIVRESGRSRVLVVANKVAAPDEVAELEARVQHPLFAVIPADPAIGAADRAGAALIDHASSSPALDAIREVADRLRHEDESEGAA